MNGANMKAKAYKDRSGKDWTITELSVASGADPGTVYMRLKRGWTVGRVLDNARLSDGILCDTALLQHHERRAEYHADQVKRIRARMSAI